ncbi:MAG: metallophosphoesterase family protein [Anaerolineae bacterium]|nr:metallophosphoesterase family protein [Anaerolineae bacterium]
MRIGLLSDTHNQVQNVKRAAETFRSHGVHTVLHAGDITGPNVVRALQGFDVWLAWGNMDRDAHVGSLVVEIFGSGRIDTVQFLNLHGKSLVLLHGDDGDRLRALIRSGAYDYVIHGHTHAWRDERVGCTRVINPGALGGSGWRARTYAILDLAMDDLTRFEL